MADPQDNEILLKRIQHLSEWQRIILEGANLSIISTDTVGVIRSFNRAAENMLGYSADEVVGKCTPGIFHDVDEVTAHAGRLSDELGTPVTPGFDVFVAKARRGIVEEREWTYIRRDGSRFPVLLSVTPLRNTEGVIEGFLGIAMDITLRKQLDQAAALARENALSHELIEALDEGVICLTQEAPWTIRFINQRAAHMLGVTSQRATGGALGSLIDLCWGDLEDLLKSTGPGTLETPIALAGSRHEFPAACTLRPIIQLSGDATAILTLRDISEQRRAERRRLLSDKVFENSSEAIMITDPQGAILAVNPAFSAMTGYTASEAVGRSPDILNSGQHDTTFLQRVWRNLRKNGQWSGEIIGKRSDGSLYPKWLAINAVREHDHITHFVAMFTDITERKKTEEKISYLAYHDNLTGLPNRIWLQEQAGAIIARAQRSDTRTAVLFIDLDRFKNVNDSLGHHIGDKLLVELANRLSSTVRASDTAVRLGGDEFLVIAENITDVNDAAKIAIHVQDVLGHPVIVDNKTLHTPPSMGIALYPDDGQDLDTLIQHADTAMYRVKASGRNHWLFFEQRMNADVLERLELENDMRMGIQRDEFLVYFQPQWSHGGDVMCGFEALMRWRHPQRGLIPPDKFIPIAEDTGLILPLGERVLRTACATMRRWEDTGWGKYNISVNLSARQFRHTNLVELVTNVLADTGLPAKRLELEMTESVLMDDAETASLILHQLKALGVGLSVDDFGTGYSSLAYLKMFPIDKLKIDRSFVDGVNKDPNDAAIVGLIISLAISLGITTVAEGVESEEQLEFLIDRGCTEFQGFLFARPMPFEEASSFAERQHDTPKTSTPT